MARWYAVGRLVSTFLAWWGDELSSCASDWMARIAPQWRRALTVYVDDNRLVMMEGDAAHPHVMAELACADFGVGLPDALPAPLLDALERGRKVRLRVPASRAFIRRLYLPLAAVPHLNTAMALQLPKLLPLDPQRLITDYELIGADAADGRVAIDLAALKRSDIEPVEKALQSWGLRVASLQLGEQGDGNSRFRFATAEAPGRKSTFSRMERILLGTAATLGLACAAAATTQWVRADLALKRAKDHSSVAASAAMVNRQQLFTKLEPLTELSRLESEPSTVALLIEITARVPHDSWLTTLELQDHHLRLVGISPDSGALVKELSSSALLAEVELRNSLSAGIGTGKDRFEITADTRATSP